MADNKDKRTASQRIEDLERTVMAAYQTLDQMARDLMTIKEAIKLLGNKTSAIATAANIPDDIISKLMLDANVAELKSKVDVLVEQGVLVADENLTDTSFVVGQEVDSNGAIVNPRLQFTLGSLNPDLRAKIAAGKVGGDDIELQEGKLKFRLLETYQIVTPQAPEASEEPKAPVEEAAAQSSSSETSEQTAAQS